MQHCYEQAGVVFTDNDITAIDGRILCLYAVAGVTVHGNRYRRTQTGGNPQDFAGVTAFDTADCDQVVIGEPSPWGGA